MSHIVVCPDVHTLLCPYFGCAALCGGKYCQGEILLRDCVPNWAEFQWYPQVPSHGVYVWAETFLCLAVFGPRTRGVPRTFVAIKDPPWPLAPKLLSHNHEGQRPVAAVGEGLGGALRYSGCKFYHEERN